MPDKENSLPQTKLPLKVLIVEDSASDAALLIRELQSCGYEVESHRVATREKLKDALHQREWDVVLSDYAMPSFTGLDALALVKETGKDTPFILISGAIGEDVAVAAIKAGAHDCLMKHQLARLGPVVERELRERAERWSRRQSEDQLRRFSWAVQQTPVSIMITDPAGLIEYVNPKFSEVTGYTLNELRGKTPRVLKSGNSPADEYARLWKEITEGREWKGIIRNRKKNGDLFWESNTISPIRDASGKITHFLATKEDITERLNTEHMLREQAALLDIANDAIHVRSLDHKILYWNKGAERLYGWNAAEVLGSRITEHGTADSAPFQTAQASLLEHGSWSGEIPQTTRSGKQITVFGRWTLVRDDHGEPQSILAIHADVTEKKLLEAQFLRAQRLESVGALASGIAHDLNNVLTPILMSMPMIRAEVKAGPARVLLDTVEAAAQRGADVVKQLLTFGRGVQGERIPLQARHLVREIVKIAGETFPKNIRVIADLSRDLWPVIGDATHLHQALMNLCVNARDAMPDGGKLHLAAENVMLSPADAALLSGVKPGHHVCIRVSDDGEGITPEVLDHLFEPFFTTKEPGKGTGLGLSTVLGIVRSHGGAVRVRSTVGKGSVFELYIPALPDAKVEPPSVSVPIPRGRGELVLVVDDEAPLRNTLKAALERHGYSVVLAPDGVEALITYSRLKSEVVAVVTDMLMSTLDGPTLVRGLRHVEPRVRIIGMTGVGEQKMLRNIEALDLPVMLTKPFSGNKLLLALHDVLSK
ncbi:MAG: PAS domain S-box protein [Opitutaceae bacterium]|jgi:hypothetical protein